MTAPTEAEIREAIEKLSGSVDFGEVIYEIVSAINYHAPDPDTFEPNRFNAVWENLRPSEARRLSDLIEDVVKQGERFEQEIIEATVQAALTFAAEYPDAPRADRELVTAK